MDSMDRTIPGTQSQHQDKRAAEISLLINSAYYFIECVFILHRYDHYRLVALHNGIVLTDAPYKTIKGARIAFSKMYKKKAWSDEVKAEWSCFYDPDAGWLEEKVEG
jgi:hypothetical protein